MSISFHTQTLQNCHLFSLLHCENNHRVNNLLFTKPLKFASLLADL